MNRYRGTLAAAVAVVIAAGMAGCGHKRTPESLSDSPAMSVDVESLWKKEAAADPIIAYKVRLASDPDNAGLHNNLGNQLVLENHMKEALREFKAAARLDSRSPIPWNNIGTTYKKLGRMLPAKDAFQKAISIDRSYALAYYNMGTLYDEQGDYDKAIEFYLEALALKPDLAEVRFNPQIVNNRNLMVVKLRHFLEESGNIQLPLDRLPE